MFNRIIEPPPLDIFKDPDDWSRSRLLNILLVGIGFIDICAIAVTIMLDIFNLGTDYSRLYIGSSVLFLGLVFLYWLNRRGFVIISGVLFLVLLTTIFLTVEVSPSEIVAGRTMLMFVVPILMSSFILRPYASFFTAGLISIVHLVIWFGNVVGVDFDPFGLITFFVIALVSWLAANSLQGALQQSRQVNQENQILIDRLQMMRQQLQQLSHQLIKVQEEERKLIARELHDEIGQTLTAVHIMLESTLQHPEADSNPTRIREASNAIQQMLAQVKSLLVVISPAELENLGLHAGLEHLIDTIGRQTGLKISLETNGLTQKRFSPDVEITAYRIVQEALTNVARHAEASEAQISAKIENQTLVLQVRDDGHGFEMGLIQQAGHSMGLTGMSERAERIGGKCQIETKPGKGTWVKASLPLAENRDKS